MSSGITIDSKTDEDIPGYFQNFAEEFDDLNFFLTKDGCDMSQYLCCIESWEDETEMVEWGATEEQIAFMKKITSEEYYPVSEVFASMNKAIELTKTYDEARFHQGKEHCVSDMQEILEALKPHSQSNMQILFSRG